MSMCKEDGERIFDSSIELKDNAMLKVRPELFNEWDFEKNDELGLDAYKITRGSKKKAWWNCPKCKENYDMMIQDRTGNHKSNCPYCSGKRTSMSNSLTSLFPKIASEWHPSLNGKWTPSDVPQGSGKVVWWICSDCKSPYSMEIYKRTSGRNCPYCAGKRVNETNSLASLFPEVAKQWHPTLNGNKTPNDVTSNNAKTYWWFCSKCDSPYDMKVSDKRKCGCPFCGGKRINYTNSLASLMPDLAKEWHQTKNGKATPDDVTLGSNDIAWWQCSKQPLHIWSAVICSRTGGNNCPYCSNQKIMKGYNDLWTTNPELAKQLLNPEDGYKHSIGNSKNKLDWLCPHCDEVVKNKTIGNTSRIGVICDICNDDFSLGERIMYFLLKSNSINFIYDQSLAWSQSRRYDFYLTTHNTIIEVHGIQHYEESRRGRSLNEEQENDKFKLSLALKNGIENYIVIDARESSFDWIMNSIKDSVLKQVLELSEEQIENFDFDEKRSFVRDSWDLWNTGTKSTEAIGAILSISRGTIRGFLQLGYSIGKCDYQAKKGNEYTKKGVVKLSLDDKKISEYESVSDAKRKNNYSNDAGIVRACQGRTALYDGFKWMYKVDYKILLATGTAKKQYAPSTNKKSVVKLKGSELLNQYDSVHQAAKDNAIKSPSHISSCCKGKRKTAYGFKWMYKEDYDEIISQKEIN